MIQIKRCPNKYGIKVQLLHRLYYAAKGRTHFKIFKDLQSTHLVFMLYCLTLTSVLCTANNWTGYTAVFNQTFSVEKQGLGNCGRNF